MNDDVIIVLLAMAIPPLIAFAGWHAFTPPKKLEDMPEPTAAGPKEVHLVPCPYGCGKRIIDGTQEYHRKRCSGPKTQRNYRIGKGGSFTR